MATKYCYYDCGEDRTKAALPPYPDVSGLGVSLSYTITATLAVWLVVIYYIFAYRPDVSPYTKQGNKPPPDFKPNRVDKSLLFWRLSSLLWNADLDPTTVTRSSRIRKGLVQCMLVMSDFQLLTGISILISGFTQLRCGITAYHWQKVVRLAWLSSITHLCCLTFLRDYLYQHRSRQILRITGMVLLVIMLIIALIPTRQYTWSFGETSTSQWGTIDRIPNPQSYAICSFYVFHSEDRFSPTQMVMLKASQQRLIFSAVLIGFGMFQRLWRLFEVPTSKYFRLRRWTGRKARSVLWRVYTRIKPNGLLSHVATVMVYLPLLAAFVSLRYLLDIFTSMAFEIWLLIISFALGVTSLWYRKPDEPSEPEPGRYEWTYGQVMAVLLLVPPLIALIEGYLTNIGRKPPKKVLFSIPESNLSQNPILYQDTLDQPSPAALHTPDLDDNFYRDSLGFPPLVYAGLWAAIGVSVRVLVKVFNNSGIPLDLFRTPPEAPFAFTIPLVLAELGVGALLALAVGTNTVREGKRRLALQVLLFGFYSTLFLAPMWIDYVRIGNFTDEAYGRGYSDGVVSEEMEYRSHRYGNLRSFNFLWVIIVYLGLYLVVSICGIWKGWLRAS